MVNGSGLPIVNGLSAVSGVAHVRVSAAVGTGLFGVNLTENAQTCL